MAALSEFESKRLLATYGVPVSEDRLAATPSEAVEAAGQLAGPVAVKLCGAGLAHKSERNLVRLGVQKPDAVRAAAEELLAAALPGDGDVAVLVSEMVRGHREFIAGVADDGTFGLALMLGVGGIFAEAVADVSFRLLPVTEQDCEDLMDDLAAQRLLGPLRGEPAVDRAALARCLLGLSAAAEQVQGLEAIDVNPLVIRDGLPVAVDALVVTRP